mgnify:CR=1 FL=1
MRRATAAAELRLYATISPFRVICMTWRGSSCPCGLVVTTASWVTEGSARLEAKPPTRSDIHTARSSGASMRTMLKDSSLVSTIALSDILRKGREYISRTFLSLETMLVVALIYLIITLMLSRLVGMLEERLHNNG